MYKVLAIVLLGLVASSVALPRGLKKVPGGGRIVGGTPAKQGELPYQIALYRSNSFICGGSVVAANVIVTAAHCVDGQAARLFAIMAGDLSRSDTSGKEQTRQVQQIIVHEAYDDWTSENDIALLILAEPLELNDDVQPVMLPSQHQDTDAELTGTIRVSGWGTTSSGGSLPDGLQWVEIPIVSDADCRRAYGSANEVADSMLCAGLLGEGGKDSCQGDSGGPLVHTADNTLVGVVSWGIGCAHKDYPGVNTEVSYFANWVQTNSP